MIIYEFKYIASYNCIIKSIALYILHVESIVCLRKFGGKFNFSQPKKNNFMRLKKLLNER